MLQPADIARIEDLLSRISRHIRKTPIRHRHERGLQGQTDAERRFPSL